MFDELEIACWIKFIDRFNLLEETYSVYDPQYILQSCLWQIFYIAVATKLLLNDENSEKEMINAHLNTIDTGFSLKFHQW